MDWERLTPEELESLESGGLPDAIHPHYPFVVIDQLLRAECPALIQLWTWRSGARAETVTRWCFLAKTHPWAWDDCAALLRHLVWRQEEIPQALRWYTRLKRPRRAGRRTTLARDLRIEEAAASLEDRGFSRTEAEFAITLYLSAEPHSGLDESTVRKARQRARKWIADIEPEHSHENCPGDEACDVETAR